MCFGASIEEVGSGRGESLFPVECRFETLFDESFANVGDGVSMTVKLFGNVLIGDTTVDVFVEGEEDIGVFDFAGVGFAFGDELRQFVSFVGGEGNFVKFFHGNFRVRRNK